MSQLLRYSKSYLKLSTQFSRICRYSTTATTTITQTTNESTQITSKVPIEPVKPVVQVDKLQKMFDASSNSRQRQQYRPRRSLFTIINELKDSYSIYRLNNSELIDEALNIIDRQSLNKSTLMYLMDIISYHLEYVLPEKRQDRLEYLWNKIKSENLIDIDSNLYYVYLKGILNLNVDVNLVLKAVNEMKEKKIEITPQILEAQFEAYCKLGEIGLITILSSSL
jgi:hypothetical protein